MAYFKTDALVLRVIDYGETSQIATFYTREKGKLAVIAKGAKRRSSRFQGALEPLTLVEVVCVARRETASLHTLTEVELRDGFRGARASLSRLYAATYVLELVREVTPDEDPEPALFDAAIETLRRLGAGGEDDVAVAVLGFEARALEVLGLFPEVARCAGCAAPLESARRPAGPGAAALHFGVRAGGALCGDCAASDRTARPVSPGALRALQALARVGAGGGPLRLKLAKPLDRELRELMNRYIAASVERELRLAKYL